MAKVIPEYVYVDSAAIHEDEFTENGETLVSFCGQINFDLDLTGEYEHEKADNSTELIRIALKYEDGEGGYVYTDDMGNMKVTPALAIDKNGIITFCGARHEGALSSVTLKIVNAKTGEVVGIINGIDLAAVTVGTGYQITSGK